MSLPLGVCYTGGAFVYGVEGVSRVEVILLMNEAKLSCSTSRYSSAALCYRELAGAACLDGEPPAWTRLDQICARSFSMRSLTTFLEYRRKGSVVHQTLWGCLTRCSAAVARRPVNPELDGAGSHDFLEDTDEPGEHTAQAFDYCHGPTYDMSIVMSRVGGSRDPLSPLKPQVTLKARYMGNTAPISDLVNGECMDPHYIHALSRPA